MGLQEILAERINSLVAEEVKKIRKGEFLIGGTESESLNARLCKKASSDKEMEFQRMSDDVYILSTLLNCAPQQTNLYKRFRGYVEHDSELRKAMDTATVGAGKEWVPTVMSAEMIQLVTLGYKVAALHPRVNMTSKTLEIPRKTSQSILKLKHTENTAVAASNPGTGKLLLTAKTLAVFVPFSYELDEDSITPALPMIKMDMANAISLGIEDAIINGQNTAVLDSDVTAADDVRKAWDGYRLNATGARAVDGGGALTIDKIRQARQALGTLGVDVNQLAIVGGVKVYNALIDLKDASGNRVTTTVDKYGPSATILTGEVAKVDGMSVICSEKVREDLNASGVYDGLTTTKSVLLIVRKDGWVLGDRRLLLVETFRDIKAQSIDVVASVRNDFGVRYAATQYPAAEVYNI